MMAYDLISYLPTDIKFLSDKVLNDPKYKEFKSVGEKLLNMMKEIENWKDAPLW